VQRKLWGSLEDLERTAGFIIAAGDTIYHDQKSQTLEEERS
jgi:hypothetical protein